MSPWLPFSFDAAAPLCHHFVPETLRISFRISILASGSTGNATLLETEHTTLLVDAGLGRKEIFRRFDALGRARPERVDAILVTHEHTDHSTGLAQMAREWNCPAYLTEPTHREIVKMYTEDPEKPGKKATIERVEYIRAGERFEIGDIEINPFAIPHDAADPVGYAFRTNGTKVAIVTDLGYMPELVKHHLREADFLILESNHDLEMLKVGPYPWHVKQRVMSRTGHLSNDVVSDFLPTRTSSTPARAISSSRISPSRTTRRTSRKSAPSRLS